MDDKPLYNSRVIITFLEFLRQTKPEIDISALLKTSGISSYEVEDEGHWLTQTQVDAFHDALISQVNDPGIFREAGRYMASSKSINAIRQFIFGFLTPIQAYNMLGKIASYLNRGTTFKARKISRNKVEIITKPKDGVNEKPYQCENRMGSLEVVPMLFTNKLPNIEHPDCIHRGGEQCRYIISWQEPLFLKWNRIHNYSAIALLCIIIAGGFFLSLTSFLGLGLLNTLIFLGITYYAQYVEKKDIYAIMEMQGDAANRLLDQITMGYNNALVVQEIGQAVSRILDIDILLRYVMDALHKRLDFDRGMIMLANSDKSRLVYMSGYGYEPEIEAVLRKTDFHLDNARSKGPFVVAYRQQEPFLINDIHDLKQDISARSSELVEILGAKSFICVPIVFEGISEGILAVDNYQSGRPLNQSEVSLLMGIAPQIAISINNARALKKVMESEERFRTLSENSPDIIYTTNPSGLVSYVNPAIKDMMRYDEKEVTGHYLTEFMNQEDVASYERLFQDVVQNNETIKNFELKLMDKSGVAHLFNMSGAPNFNASGEMTGMVGILKDVTEQRKLEQHLNRTSKMEAVGTLTGGIAHDFNNILQAIISYNQILMIQKSESDRDWKYLNKINGLAKRATDLINQLLIFSRKIESRLTAVDVNAEIRNYYTLLLSTLPKTILIELDLAKDLRLVNGDSAQIGQIVMNLSVNAQDAMPDGGNLSIHTRNVEFKAPFYRENTVIRQGAYVQITVSDTGCGIDKETLEHIFEPFFTTKELGKGTGIGLSVVYGIIRNHNGYIFCVSEPGKGTSFELYLPAFDMTWLDHQVMQESEGKMLSGHETILLVDDESSLLETGQELLSYLGYHVITTNSGEKALEVIAQEKERISLVILDLMMPGMSGEKCLPEILKIVPMMKVIIASGYTANSTVDRIEEIGAAAFIKKPYQLDDLSRIIRETLDYDGQST
jgi:PAS domain S-box-containing protein